MAVLSYLEIVLAANSASFNQSIADARSQTKVAFSDMREYANKMGPAVAASIGAAAVATTALVAEQVALANELQHTANVANSSIKEIQRYTVGAKKMGIEQDALGAIFQDTSDKIGDFLSTGGGGMADFFENIAPQIGVTAEQFRELSGPQALQLYYDSLDRANLSQNEMTFYMEAMASDATTLIPLLADGGAGFDTWAQAAENAGAVMDAETIRATKELQATTDLLELSVDGAKTQFVAGFIPVLSDAAGELVGTADAADAARLAGENFGEMLKSVSKIGVGAVTVFETIGTAIGGFAAGVAQLGNGVDWDSPFAFFQMGQNFLENNRSAAKIFAEIPGDISNLWLKSADRIDRISALGTGSTNKTVAATMQLNERQATLNRTLGQTGQQYQAQQKAAEDAAKASEKAIKSAKDLGAAYVSNTALSGLNLKSKEAIAGGKARGYTAEFAEVTQSLLGSNLKYFSAINDSYHAGSNSKHASGQAFDVVLKDAKQAKQAANMIEQAAKQYGYNVKILNEYAKPSKNATGGHLHVSVYGQKPVKNGSADIQYIKQQNAALAQEQSRAAAEQTRILEQQAQQAQQREAIRLEYANQATRIEMQLADKIDKINASGFNDDERIAFVEDAKQRAAIELANYQDTQAKKLTALGDFARSERDIIVQNAAEQATAALRDLEFSDEARQQALDLIKQKAVYQLNQLDLTHDQQMQYAQQSEQTDAERIRNQYALERREIQLTVNMDEQLRKAKIDALNQAEQLALDERRYAYERELRDLTSIGQSDLAALRQSYADQRRVLDARTDIDDGQKSGLRNAMAGAQIYDTNQLQQGPRDAFESQQAQLGGYSQQYGLDQQLKQQLEVIENAKKAELLTVETYEQAKFATQQQYQQQTQQMMLGGAQEQFGSVTELMRLAFGEQNALYQAAFIGQKAMSIAQAVIAIPESYSKAFNAVVGIPFVGPALAPAAGIAAAALQVAQKAMIEQVQPPSMPGFEVGGYTGAGGTSDVAGLVHKEEFVANAPTTKRFRPELEAMHDGSYDKKYRNQGVNININNNAPVDITTSVNDDGSIEMRIDKRINERVPQMMAQQINTPASPVRNALTNNFNLERRF